jgi:hypothetical protein
MSPRTEVSGICWTISSKKNYNMLSSRKRPGDRKESPPKRHSMDTPNLDRPSETIVEFEFEKLDEDVVVEVLSPYEW